MGDALPYVELGGAIKQLSCTSPSFTGSQCCALLTSGTVRCWGEDVMAWATGLDPILGNAMLMGAMPMSQPPVDLGLPASLSVVGLSVGSGVVGHGAMCAILSDGNIKCWGHNIYGQLGYGDRLDRGYMGTMGTALQVVPLAMLTSTAGTMP